MSDEPIALPLADWVALKRKLLGEGSLSSSVSNIKIMPGLCVRAGNRDYPEGVYVLAPETEGEILQ